MSVLTRNVVLLLFGSGFCALVYQIAWLRLLRLVFGASTAANAAVLAIFMAGLGVGGWWLGRRADRHRRPLVLYAHLEIGVAILAAVSPLLISGVRWGYVALGGTEQLGTVAGTLLRLVLSAIVLGAPTFLMGGTLPAVARAVTRASDQRRRSLALLYGANTLGAVAGALVTTFLALELLGVQRTIWAASLLNLVVALIARHLGLRAAAVAEDGEEAVAEARKDRGAAPVERSADLGFVLFAAGAVGFAFLLMELVWYRMLAPILGGSSYTFGLILAIALVGIGLGGLLYSLGGEGRRPTLASFAATCSLEALFLILPFALGDRLAVFALMVQPLGDLGFGMLTFAWSLVTALVVLPASIVAGYQFPLLVALLGSARRDLGREIGLAYACNTAGSILGSIAGGFGLIPLLSAPGAWRGSACLLLALAAASLAFHLRGGARGRRSSAVMPGILGILGLALALTPGPSAFWRHTPIGAGRIASSFDGPNALEKEVRERRRSIVWEEDGVESSVALAGQAQYIFLLNGKSDGSALRDAPNMVMSVLTGAALHPQPERALVIGLGSGLSAGWLAEVPSIDRVDVVELEPAVARVAGLCSPVNFDVLNHPKIDLRIADGRELLLTTGERYDLIFSQPSNPYRAGVASLFSREFYQAVEKRLNDGGLLLQWLQGYEIDADLVGMAYATLSSVFPSVESWQVHETDLLLVASREPVLHDLDRIRDRVGTEPWKSALETVLGVDGVDGFYAGYIGSPELGASLAGHYGERINTDDHPHMEFGFVRTLGRQGLFDLDSLRQIAEVERWDRPRFTMSTAPKPDWLAAAEARTAASATWGGRPRTPRGLDEDARRRVRARQLYRQGDLRQALLEWFAQSEPPRMPLDRLLWAETLAEFRDERALAAIEEVRLRNVTEAEAVLARWWLRNGDLRRAADHLIDVFERSRRDPWVYPPILARSLELTADLARQDRSLAGELADALAEPFAVRLLDELRLRARATLSVALDEATCVAAYEGFEPHVPWEGGFLLQRFRCYERARHELAESAKRDVQTFLDQAPPRLESGLLPEGR